MKIRILIIAAAIATAACATVLTPEQIVIAAGKTEIAANRLVAEYKVLPRCGGMVAVPLCSTQTNADLADKVLDAAGVTIDAAEVVVRDPRFDGDAATTAALAAGAAADAALEVIEIIRR